MKRISLFIIVVAILFVAAPAHAQSPITVTANRFVNNFRSNLTFELDAASPNKITKAELVVAVDTIGDNAASSRLLSEFTPDNSVQAKYVWNLNTKYMPPGVSGQYWWDIEDGAGNKRQTDKQPFRIEDKTRTWRKLSNEKFALYWYAGSDAFGKQLFDAAVQALVLEEKDINVTVNKQLQILLYANHDDFVRAQDPTTNPYVVGRAYSQYGVTLIQAETNDLQGSLITVPHELAHLVLYFKLGSLGYTSLPLFLNEGLATYYQSTPPRLEKFQEDVYRPAIRNDTLIPLRLIVGNFGEEPNRTFLSYAEGFSVVDFIIRKYGAPKFAQLLDAFKNPRHYDDVFKEVFGMDLDNFENEWRKDIGAKPRAIPTRDPRQPTAIPTFSLSSDFSPSSSATATPPSVARNVTPAPVATSAPAAPAPTTISCGGGVALLLGMVGVFWLRRKSRIV